MALARPLVHGRSFRNAREKKAVVATAGFVFLAREVPGEPYWRGELKGAEAPRLLVSCRTLAGHGFARTS